MSLRMNYAESFAKFVKENKLMPRETDKDQYRGSFIGDSANSIIFRAPKCKFYGVLFYAKGIPQSMNNSLVTMREVECEGIIKVYSPRYIQVWHCETLTNGRVSSTSYPVFDNLVNAIMYINQMFILMDRQRANCIPQKGSK